MIKLGHPGDCLHPEVPLVDVRIDGAEVLLRVQRQSQYGANLAIELYVDDGHGIATYV